MKSYLDFDLSIEKHDTGYHARVLNSPAGQASNEFSLPFSELELENFLLRIGQQRQGMRRMESTAMAAAKQFGGQLFQALFAGEIKGCLQSSLDEASYRNAGLRIRLRLSGSPDLLDIPWEFLYNATLNRFLLLSIDSPLVRYLDLPGRVNSLKVTPPLRILVMIASPSDYIPLDVEHEWQVLKQAVAELEARGLLVVERLDLATLAALQKQLQRADYHIFHFIGHGGYDAQAEDGVLLLEDERGQSRAVSGQYLGMILHDAKTLRLALLNSCEGARTARTDPFAGVCQSLLQQGIPAVLAMQFAISDKAAITLACEFYTALAAGLPVDTALTEARKGIFADHNDIEWGTPVLYMRTPDGQIFDVTGTSKPQSTSPSESDRKVDPITKRRRPTYLLLLLAVPVVLVGLWLVFRQSGTVPIDNSQPSAVVIGTPFPTDLPTRPTPSADTQAVVPAPIQQILSTPLPTETVAPAPIMAAAATELQSTLSAEAATLPSTPAPTSRRAVYNFDDGTGDGWELNANWTIVKLESGGGALQVIAPPDNWSATSLIDKLESASDMMLQVRMRVLQPTNPNKSDADLKLSIRANNGDPSGFESYSLYTSHSLQNIRVRRDAAAGYDVGVILGKVGFAWELNRWYTLRMEAKSNHISVSLDGQELGAITDDVLTRGDLYLTAFYGAQIQFDEIQVER